MSHSLFLFHRDLRLDDNTGLLAAHLASETVTPVFIFEDAQLAKHDFFSTPGFQFLIQSLKNLRQLIIDKGGDLLILPGNTNLILRTLLGSGNFQTFYSNTDVTPFAKARDRSIELVCAEAGVEFFLFDDLLLHPLTTVNKSDGNPYTVFTPYANKASQIPPATSRPHTYTNFSGRKCSEAGLNRFNELNPKLGNLILEGGRDEGLSIINKLSAFADYDDKRDYPALRGTTRLSAHLKFGTVSAREVFEGIQLHFGSGHTLIRELYWRDFFSKIAYFFPHVFGGAFRHEYNRIEWDNNEKWYQSWCGGKTGFPIVDAGMRELVTTGFMHNRVRMITASFLVKDLHVDWRSGEKFFARHLIDYDPAVNNGNWQWVASSGCDAQPYFRIFNPWLQQEKFDPNADYIKKWIPELRGFKAQEIHRLDKSDTPLGTYPAAFISHSAEKSRTERLYSVIKG